MNKQELATTANLFAETDEVDRDRKVLAETVAAACASVTTTGKLLQIWPEAKDLLPEVEKKLMLAVPSQAIEDMIAKKY